MAWIHREAPKTLRKAFGKGPSAPHGAGPRRRGSRHVDPPKLRGGSGRGPQICPGRSGTVAPGSTVVFTHVPWFSCILEGFSPFPSCFSLLFSSQLFPAPLDSHIGVPSVSIEFHKISMAFHELFGLCPWSASPDPPGTLVARKRVEYRENVNLGHDHLQKSVHNTSKDRETHLKRGGKRALNTLLKAMPSSTINRPQMPKQLIDTATSVHLDASTLSAAWDRKPPECTRCSSAKATQQQLGCAERPGFGVQRRATSSSASLREAAGQVTETEVSMPRMMAMVSSEGGRSLCRRPI